jgi:hypothetical protein
MSLLARKPILLVPAKPMPDRKMAGPQQIHTLVLGARATQFIRKANGDLICN